MNIREVYDLWRNNWVARSIDAGEYFNAQRTINEFARDCWKAISAAAEAEQPAPTCEHYDKCWVNDHCNPPTAERLETCEHRQPVEPYVWVSDVDALGAHIYKQEPCVWKQNHLRTLWLPGCKPNWQQPMNYIVSMFIVCPYCAKPIERKKAANA